MPRFLTPVLCSVLLVMLSACRVTQTAGIAEINEAGATHTTSITLRSGKVLTAKLLVMHPDSTAWIDDSTHQQMSAATKDIASVTWHNHSAGLVDGLWLGGLFGGGFGTVIAAANSFKHYSPVAIPGLGAVGIFIGGLGGFIGGRAIILEPDTTSLH